jgi:hypothetical protein
LRESGREKMQNSNADSLLLEAIDETLGSLGEPVKNQIYLSLEHCCLIPRNELPGRIPDFSRFLYRQFGPNARLIEIRCMRLFYSKIENCSNLLVPSFEIDENDFSFSTFVKKIKELAIVPSNKKP